jgi:hypothetical protein
VGDWVLRLPFNPLVRSAASALPAPGARPRSALPLPIQFDPSKLPPIFDITAPRSFAGELFKRFGLFKTIGWMIDTWSSNGTIPEEVFLEDVS